MPMHFQHKYPGINRALVIHTMMEDSEAKCISLSVVENIQPVCTLARSVFRSFVTPGSWRICFILLQLGEEAHTTCTTEELTVGSDL